LDIQPYLQRFKKDMFRNFSLSNALAYFAGEFCYFAVMNTYSKNF
jgi:hypothetical protein